MELVMDESVGTGSADGAELQAGGLHTQENSAEEGKLLADGYDTGAAQIGAGSCPEGSEQLLDGLMAGLSGLLGGYDSGSEDGSRKDGAGEAGVSHEGEGVEGLAGDAISMRTSATRDALPPGPATPSDAATATIVDVGVTAASADVEIKPGCRVRVHGLLKAMELNDRQGLARRFDPTGRWEVELEAAPGKPRAVKSIRQQNLVVLTNDGIARLQRTAADKLPQRQKLEESESKKEVAKGLVPGCKVQLCGLKHAVALNGRSGVVRRADPKSCGRWEVEFRTDEAGLREVKSIREENIVREDNGWFRTDGPDQQKPQIADGAVTKDAPMGSGCSTVELAEEHAMGKRLQPIQPSCLVWVEGLQSATQLNGRKGTVSRPDPDREGRWEVEFYGENCQLEMRASIRQENLVLAGDEDAEGFLEDDGYGDAAPESEEEDKEDLDAAQEDIDEAVEFDGLEAGATVRIMGLSSTMAKPLNDQVGTLVIFDPVPGRWQVRLQGGDTKAIKPENLALEALPTSHGEGQDRGKFRVSGGDESMKAEGCASITNSAPDALGKANTTGLDSGDYDDWDANEIAAAVVQAELSGDAGMTAKLKLILMDRRAQDASLAARGLQEGPLIDEVMQVPEAAVGFVIGRGGESIHKLTAESGARLTITRPKAGMPTTDRTCTIRGLESEVAKARHLVQEAIAQGLASLAAKGDRKGKGKPGKGGKGGKGSDLVSGGASGRSGFSCGICKWYAAGFCRNRTFSGGCSNGLHSSEAARKAEVDWVAQGPDACTARSRAVHGQPVLLLLDLEGGGNAQGRDGEDEIIEMPVLAMCPSTGRELGRFHRFVRPGFWDREASSMRQRHDHACFNADSSAVSFPEAVSSMCSWIRTLLAIPSPGPLSRDMFLFVTCGDWDVKRAIPRQCNNPKPGMVDSALQQLLFSRWCNLKEVFREHYKLLAEVAPTGMRGMLRRLGMPLIGQHHLGMDDVSNLAKILLRLICENCRIEATGHANPLARRQGPSSCKGCKGASRKGKGKPKGGCKGKGSSVHVGQGAPPLVMPSFSATPLRPPVLPTQHAPAVIPVAATGLNRVLEAVDSEVMAASGNQVQQGLDVFLQGAPLPGGEWVQREGSNDGDSMDDEAKAAPSAGHQSASHIRPRPGEFGTFDELDSQSGIGVLPACLPKPHHSAGQMPKDGGRKANGDAGLLAGVFEDRAPRATAGAVPGTALSGDEPPAKAPKIDSLLAGLPTPMASSGVTSAATDEPPTKVPRISALLAGLPPPKSAGGD